MIPIGDDARRQGFPWMMLLLIAGNVVVFVAQLGMGPRVDLFILEMGLVPTEFLSGTDLPPCFPGPIWMTLVTSTFIHGGIVQHGHRTRPHQGP